MKNIVTFSLLSLGLLFILTQKAQAATNINDCGVLNQAGETYILTQDVSADETCFTLTGNNITLDLNGHTVNYAQIASGIGVDLGNGYLYTGNIIKNGTLSGGMQNNSHGIYFGDGRRNNIEIYDLNINVQGTESNGIYLYASDNIQIHDVVITMNSEKENQCSHYSGHIYGIGLNHPGGNIDIYNNTITGKGMLGISATDCVNPFTEDMLIYNNYISLWSPVRDGYAISIASRNHACSDGTEIYNNTINQTNGRGIAITGWDSEADDGPHNVEIYNNNVTVREGWDCEYNAPGTAVGLRVRFGAGNVYAHDNYFYGHAGTGVAQGSHPTSDGSNAVGLYVGAPEPYGYGNVYENNYVEVSTNNSSFFATGVYVSDVHPPNETGLAHSFINNTFKSNHQPIRISGSDGGGAKATFTNNTVIKGDNPLDYKTVTIGYWRFGAQDINFIDTTVQNGAAMDDILFLGSCEGFCPNYNNIYISKTLNVAVKDNSNNPVSDANIIFIGANGETVASGSTNGSGILNQILWIKGYEGETSPVMTEYSPYTYLVTKDNQSTNGTIDMSSTVNLNINLGDETVTCSENWSCTDWSTCNNGTKTRTCMDANSCGTTSSQPIESETCEVVTDNTTPDNNTVTDNNNSNTSSNNTNNDSTTTNNNVPNSGRTPISNIAKNESGIESTYETTIETDPLLIMKNKAQQLFNNDLELILFEIQELRSIAKEQASETKYLQTILSNLNNIAQEIKDIINQFITYGVDHNTKRLGAGERAAVIHSYKTAYGKLPENENDFTDVIKIANGRWPSLISLSSEIRAKNEFKKIYLREANMNNPNDNAAITIMAYGLRQRAENRNLNSEKQGIKTFKYIYNKLPETTEEWNIMQAITYSGATR